MFNKLLAIFILFVSLPGLAQYNAQMAGTGYWAGNQGCGYQQQPAQGAISVDDTVSEIQKQIAELKKELSSKKTEKKRADRDADRSKKEIERNISDDYSEFIIAHIEGPRRCDEYKGLMKDGVNADGDSGGKSLGGNSRMLEVEGFTTQEWSSYCDSKKAGSVYSAVCDNASFRQEGTRTSSQSCKKALTEYRSNYAKSTKLQDDIEDIQSMIERANDDLADAKQDAIDRQADNSNTEGDYCPTCGQRGNSNASSSSFGSSINSAALVSGLTGLVTGGLAMYVGHQADKAVAENNASIGYPTYSPSSWSYGMPYFAQGLYGTISALNGQGSFGCGNSNMMGGMNGSSVFGYPNGMMGMNTMGGGIYMNGMNPYMMAGMNGMNGMMGNMMSSYGNGMMGMNGMMSNMMNSYGNGMVGMNGMMSNMMNSFVNGLYGNNMMNSYVNGLYGNNMMNSYVNGLYGNNMMNSYVNGLYGNNMMSAFANGIMGNMMSNGAYSTGYDQYSLQMAQLQMQYQQQYQQQQGQKYSALMSLQSEINSLSYKMQLVNMGYGTNTSNYTGTTYTGSSYTGTYTGYASGVLPAPGSTSTSTYYTTTPGVIPLNTSTTTGVISGTGR